MIIRSFIIPASRKLNKLLTGIWLLLLPVVASAQAVSEIVTDYNGFWRSGTGNLNPVLPDNHHNLVSFSFNGTRYSTGVNDALLSANGLAFTPGEYHALPLQNVNGTVSGNTKIGLGAMIDGVFNGGGPAPSRSLGPWLNDGTNGLDMGTCVANLPAGTMFMSVSNVQASKIGDGIPDIIVTQIADPSSTFDSYEFTDVNGVRVGSPLDVVLNNIQPVGNWVADFYEATGATILQPGFTQTSRNIRLWAADFSSFGLDASNIGNIAYFKITLSGQSDIAFVAYNTSTITVQQVLSLQQTNRIRRERPAEEAKGLTVYPNPATATICLSHPRITKSSRICLYNMDGIPVKMITPATGSITTAVNVTSLPKGLYQAVLMNGDKKFSQKFIIQ